ncbi:MAG: acetoacetate decarboxylase [Ralstonia sp.]|uniref:acetoacetate decarboxylase n=1 Tax=Ralstonia sp. TaxID=54061 RepID=UPI00257BF5B8|nr:acetoacetate decarboxylase [Ralstonia sp.]MBA4234038.1 acetoacetate decarboxylase [Ralstonia sp.]
MNVADVLKLSSMPMASPTYPRGPYRFVNREYMIITYETDPDAIRRLLPEPLQPDGSNTVFYEFARMPDSSGFGDYTQTGIVIPCLFEGVAMQHVSQMFLDSEPPIAGGREIWGFPQKLGRPALKVVHDTLTGTLDYADQPVAIGTMAYKHEALGELLPLTERLGSTRVNLKLIPHADGTPAIAQLVAYQMTDITVKGAWSGPARLHLVPHVNAPVADLPVRRAIGGLHAIADVTLPYGTVLFDYLKN